MVVRSITEIVTPKAAAEIVRADRIIAFITEEIAEMRAIDQIRKDRSKGRTFSPCKKYSVFTTRESIISKFGIGRLKDPEYLRQLAMERLDEKDYRYWWDNVVRSEELSKVISEIASYVLRDERPPAVSVYANKIHMHSMMVFHHLRRDFGKRGILARWLKLSRSRPANTVVKKIRKIQTLLDELAGYNSEIDVDQRELLLEILGGAYAWFGDKDGV